MLVLWLKWVNFLKWEDNILTKPNLNPWHWPGHLVWQSWLFFLFPRCRGLSNVLCSSPRFASSSNDAGCAWLDGRSASDFLRKAGGCNFLVANPTNQLFTAFHRDVISYRPTACSASFVALKGRNNVRFALARPHLIIEHWGKHGGEDDERLGFPHQLTFPTELNFYFWPRGCGWCNCWSR